MKSKQNNSVHLRNMSQLLTFGKHRGKTIQQISDIDPQYIVWLYELINGLYIPESLYLQCIKRQDKNK